MAETFLSLADVARLLGVKPQTLVNLKLPPPDVVVGKARGWRVQTIEAWNAARPGHGGRPVTG